jgi:hypothetical protein
VAEAWDRPSALEGMSVGALAVHLAGGLLLVSDAWHDRERWSEDDPVPLLEHYRRSAWVAAGPGDEANVAIRESAGRDAAAGPAAMRDAVEAALADLESLPGAERLPVAVQMAWWRWSLSFEDFLVTRMMEIVVHSDDLAVSVGIDPPELAANVLEPVLSLLVGVATMRHGQAAVVRALSRAERAPASIAAF